jgi:hypothetical protein
MSLKTRLKQLEGRQPKRKVSIWGVLLDGDSPDELDDEGRAMCEFLLTPTPDDEYDPIEARIREVEAMAISRPDL